jgi:hypothetical protein
MSSGLYGWKPPSPVADYIRERDLRDAIARQAQAQQTRFQESRDWLAGYLSQNRRSRFDWSPKIITKQRIEETINVKEAEEEYLRTAQEAADADVPQGLGDAAQEPSAAGLGEHGTGAESGAG